MLKELDYQRIHKLPKVELHCHFDGSVPVYLLRNLLLEKGEDPALLERMVAPEKCEDLKEYLSCFQHILALLQSTSNITRAAKALALEMVEENICYGEIRFAPMLHTEEGLSVTEVVTAVSQGVAAGLAGSKTEINLLICLMRHHSEAANQQVVTELAELTNQNIVGFDFAGDEAAVSNAEIRPLLMANDQLNWTLHSGECGCPQNVAYALEYGASRIGHGIASEHDPELLAECSQQDVLFELCPTSNLQTNAVVDWQHYPLRKFLDAGVKVCINTDNRTVSNTTLTKEFCLLREELGLTLSEMRELTINGNTHSFASAETKRKMMDYITTNYNRMEEVYE